MLLDLLNEVFAPEPPAGTDVPTGAAVPRTKEKSENSLIGLIRLIR